MIDTDSKRGAKGIVREGGSVREGGREGEGVREGGRRSEGGSTRVKREGERELRGRESA